MRAGTAAAAERLRRYSPGELASAVRALAPAERLEVLECVERVAEIVPLLPETEFTATVRGAGIEEAGWLVEFASPEQRVAAVDLDCWQGARLSPTRLFEWLDALIEAGPETLAAALGELAPELWTLLMQELGEFSVAGLGDEPGGRGASLDGIVFWDAASAESEERIEAILGAALHHAPPHYWRLVFGAISASRAESEEWALRWHRNRLGDLGFPERERAMRAYAPLTVKPDGGKAPSRAPSSRGLLGRALGELAPAESDGVMADVLVVANFVAVADRMPLSEAETIRRSFEKAVRGVERGLEELARVRGLPPRVALRETAALDLFRIGATLDPELRPEGSLADVAAAEAGEDWNVETEVVAEADRTIGPDGRLPRT